jgi:hypothetical protein
MSDGCGGTLNCGSCAAGQTCNASNVCQTTTGCTGTISTYGQGVCGATVVYQGKLYRCASQTAGVNGGSTSCGTAGVYCNNVAPDNAAWGSTAWTFVQSCP